MVIRHNKRKYYMAPAWLVLAFMATVVMLVAMPCRANKVKHKSYRRKTTGVVAGAGIYSKGRPLRELV